MKIGTPFPGCSAVSGPLSLFLAGFFSASASAELPTGGSPLPPAVPHFPSRMHAFVFRNWNLVSPERLAAVLRTRPDNVVRVGTSMGLTPGATDPEFIRRGYITLLRRNWHLLPYEQLMELVDMTEAELAYALLEDDFLFIKFGRLKPICEPLRWSEPTPGDEARAREIAATLRRHFGDALAGPGEPRFGFVEHLKDPVPGGVPPVTDAGTDEIFRVRYIYSYMGLYGDPLMDPELGSFPEGLLQRLSARGVNGIWVHIVLRNLAPGGAAFPEFGEGHEERLRNLRRLVSRAGRYGIGVYLYLNEPRAMAHGFFAAHPEYAGVRGADVTALCTAVPAVRTWLESSLTHVFREVPGLAGGFTISASENLTNCASHGGQAGCPRCKDRDYDDIIADANALIERGVHAGNPDAKVLVWDWGWRGHGDAPGIIAKLPEDVWLLSVSEWSLPIERGGVATTVGEYGISVVGPGPRATRHWELAKARGLKTAAKVQFNATWELSSIPYIPVPDLVAEHCRGLAASGVDGMMLSWTVGGFPSPNLEVAQRFSVRPIPEVDEVLDALARKRFGDSGSGDARTAWRLFSRAFREYPYHGQVVYTAPVQIGPANLLYAEPTGYRATMTGFPYDDLATWRGPYPADVFIGQFERMTAGWEEGLGYLEKAVGAAPAVYRAEAEAELRFARAAHAIFRSVRNQCRYVSLRGVAGNAAESEALLNDEIETAAIMYGLVREDSRIGFEAANQYFFVENDLLEKVLNCEYLKGTLAP